MIRKIVFTLSVLELLGAVAYSAPVELAFPAGLSWKAVFGSGFRPKHVLGLEATDAECKEQEVIFKLRDKSGFPLDRGRLMFELQSDDSIRVIEHTSRVPISMEEGQRRLDEFRVLFDQAQLRSPGSVPPLKDEARGSVMSLSDYYAMAEDAGYRIHYGFTSSFRAGKPLLPVFMISVRGNMKGPSLPIRRKVVTPPEGYEWYSLDPKVSTPDPGTAAPPDSATKQPDKPEPQNPAGHPKPSGAGKSSEDNPRWLWWVMVFILIVAGISFFRRLSTR